MRKYSNKQKREDITSRFSDSAYFGLLGQFFDPKHSAKKETPEFRIVNHYYLHKKYPLSAITPHACHGSDHKQYRNDHDQTVLRKYTRNKQT